MKIMTACTAAETFAKLYYDYLDKVRLLFHFYIEDWPPAIEF